MHELNFTKFLNVQSPIGIMDRESKNPYQSIGIDLYMPEVDDKFIDTIPERNEGYKVINIERDEDQNITYFEVFGNHKTVMFFENGIFTINEKIQLPSGIGIEIPLGYHVNLDTKSSNYSNEFSQVVGLVDCNYTYGMGFQIFPLRSDVIVNLEVNQKIAQLVMIKSEPIVKFNEKTNDEWNNLPGIIDRREERTDGFGHTGKFD